MRADMDERMDAERLAQPEAEGDQLVARRQGRVVVVGAAVGGAAAIGGERHRDVAEGGGAEGEVARGEGRRSVAPPSVLPDISPTRGE